MATLIMFGSQFHCKHLLTEGWAAPEKDIVWSNASISKLKLPVHPLCNSIDINLNFQLFLPPSLGSQRIRVTAQNCPPMTHNVRRSGFLELTAKKDAGTQIEIQFEFLDAIAPSSAGQSTDDRILAIALRHLILRERFSLETLFEVGSYTLLFQKSPAVVEFIRQQRDRDAKGVNHLCDRYEAGACSLDDLFTGYIAGVGSEIHARRRLVEKIQQATGANETMSNPFSSQLVLERENLAVSSNELARYAAHTAQIPAQEIRLWPETANGLRLESFPVAYGKPLTNETIPAFTIYYSQQYQLCASPYNFCLIHRYTGGFRKDVISQDIAYYATECCHLSTSGRSILLQDRFDNGNIAHFLFDSVTRMIHFIQEFGVNESDIFVFGGIPTKFHEIVLDAIRDFYSLPKKSLVFPVFMTKFEALGGAVWFSDQTIYTHPSQRMHPKSIAALKLVAQLCGSRTCSNRRVFISRSDAYLRRLENEDEIYDIALKYGFEKVILSEITYSEQIALLSGASHVIAPHGMGLTHLALNTHRPMVIEFFNPEIGSDAYAWMARALGFNYFPIAGKETDKRLRNFQVSPDYVEQTLEGVFYSESPKTA